MHWAQSRFRLAGNFVLDSDPDVSGTRTVSIPIYSTVSETIMVVTGYQQVSVGQVEVPEITWEQTEITEQVGTEKVVVGSEYHTMDVTLEQVGYYNPNAQGDKFREILIEGIDYFNGKIDWTNAGTAALPDRTATAVEAFAPDKDNKTHYKGFTELNDAQRWAVLNSTGFMPLYQFEYSNPQVKKTLNGNVTTTDWIPEWAANTQDGIPC